MRLAIADPPYPMMRAAGGPKRRASRWYSAEAVGASDRPSDIHPDARAWDDDATHRALLERLMDEYDGWAIATSPDGIAAYGPLPPAARIMAWIKPNGQPGSHRLRSCWEPVLLYPPVGRRSNRGGVGAMDDTLTAMAPRMKFNGAKPAEWTTWVLAALSYNPDTDTVEDLFPGSGAVADAISRAAHELHRFTSARQARRRSPSNSPESDTGLPDVHMGGVRDLPLPLPPVHCTAAADALAAPTEGADHA